MAFKLLMTALTLAVVLMEFSPPAKAAGIVIQRAEWSGRKFTVCVSDADRAPGERIQIDFFVDNFRYDRLFVTNAFPPACGEREFAPFGPRIGGRAITPLLVDEPGGAAVPLPIKPLNETCSVFAGTNAYAWCRSTSPRDDPEYYGLRQGFTFPLISDNVWAGVSLAYGGLIQQLYSSDRSYNLLDEHAGGAMGMALWGAANPSFHPLAPCNWGDPPPHGGGPPMHIMHTIFSQGRNCNYGLWAESTALGTPETGIIGTLTYLPDAQHHGRRLTMSNLNMGQIAFNRGEYLEILYGYRNLSAWDFGAMDQEIPAVHLNRTLNREFAWSRDEWPGYGYRAVAEGETWATRLVVPGVSPFSGPGTESWNGHWITVCNAGRTHCLTIAPAARPSPSGINMANLRANTDIVDTPEGQTKSNQVSLVGRFGLPRGNAIGAHTVYVFPYIVIQPLANGSNVMQRIYQLQAQNGW